MENKKVGIITKLKDSGYGFARCNETGDSYFIHASNVTDHDFNGLQEGDNVEFIGKVSDKGLVAACVVKVD